MNKVGLFNRDKEELLIGVDYLDVIALFSRHRNAVNLYKLPHPIVDMHHIVPLLKVNKGVEGRCLYFMEGLNNLFASAKDLVVTNYNQLLLNNREATADTLLKDSHLWELGEHVSKTTLLKLRATINKDLIPIL